MPRKPQFTLNDVIETAFELVRKNGWPGLSASAVANKLGCSTMPIYSHFENMGKLQDEVVIKGFELLHEYESMEYIGDAWVDQAIGYVCFAKKETNLFMCMFDGRNLELHREMLFKHWQNLSDLLEGYPAFKDLDDEQRMRIRYSRAMLSHGVATSVSMGYGEILESDELIFGYLKSASQALLIGYKAIAPLEGEAKLSLTEKIKEIRAR
jgi:AcrR family transcriptional regulator